MRIPPVHVRKTTRHRSFEMVFFLLTKNLGGAMRFDARKGATTLETPQGHRQPFMTTLRLAPSRGIGRLQAWPRTGRNWSPDQMRQAKTAAASRTLFGMRDNILNMLIFL